MLMKPTLGSGYLKPHPKIAFNSLKIFYLGSLKDGQCVFYTHAGRVRALQWFSTAWVFFFVCNQFDDYVSSWVLEILLDLKEIRVCCGVITSYGANMELYDPQAIPLRWQVVWMSQQAICPKVRLARAMVTMMLVTLSATSVLN